MIIEKVEFWKISITNILSRKWPLRETYLKTTFIEKVFSRKYSKKNDFIENVIIEKSKYYRETIYREKLSYYRDTLSRKLKIFEKLSYSNDFDKRFIEKVRSRYILSKLSRNLIFIENLSFSIKFKDFDKLQLSRKYSYTRVFSNSYEI